MISYRSVDKDCAYYDAEQEIASVRKVRLVTDPAKSTNQRKQVLTVQVVASHLCELGLLEQTSSGSPKLYTGGVKRRFSI